MKSIISSIFLLIAVLANALAQKSGPDSTKCDFLGPLHFKNGKAIVVIKASYQEFFMNGPSLIIEQLARKKYLHYKDYISDCCGGNAIAFIPENCGKKYSATLHEHIKFDLNDFKPGNTFYLTCVVFEKYKGYGTEYFFVVDNISLALPVNKKAISN
jgi:hypothetical protein